MQDTDLSIRRLNRFFVAWMLLANAALLFTPEPSLIDYWLGAGFLWALLIPLACLAWLNPRRSWGLLLAIAGALLVLVLRIGRRCRPSLAGI